MNPKFKSTLDRMAADGLCPDMVEDWDALLRLHELAESITNPPADPNESALLNPAIRVGNVTVYRPSIGARWFIAERALDWFGPEDPLWLPAVGFVLAHSREPEVLWRCSTRAALEAEAAAWVRGVGATDGQLAVAVREAMGAGDDEPKADAGPATAVKHRRNPIHGAILERLASEHGLSPETAVWRMQEAEIGVLWDNWKERKRVEEGGTSDPDSRRIQKLIAYQNAEASLRAAATARKERGGGVDADTHDVKQDKDRAVRGGKKVGGQTVAPSEAPRDDSDDQKQCAGPGHHVHDLSPSGEQERGDPVEIEPFHGNGRRIHA